MCYVKNVVEEFDWFWQEFFLGGDGTKFLIFFHMSGEITAIP